MILERFFGDLYFIFIKISKANANFRLSQSQMIFSFKNEVHTGRTVATANDL